MSALNGFDCSNFNKALECPVYQAAMKDAVMVTPCGHSFSELAAKSIFQGPISTPLTQQEPCPVCRTKVTAYYPNMAMRTVVELLLGKKPEEILPDVSKSIQEDENVNLDAIPFPGKGAKFVSRTRDWMYADRGDGIRLHKSQKFDSATKDSIFSEFTVLCDSDGDVRISISYGDGGMKYLLACGIPAKESDYGTYFSKPRELKLLFQIIAKHNEIPADKFPLIRDLAETGKWLI